MAQFQIQDSMDADIFNPLLYLNVVNVIILLIILQALPQRSVNILRMSTLVLTFCADVGINEPEANRRVHTTILHRFQVNKVHGSFMKLHGNHVPQKGLQNLAFQEFHLSDSFERELNVKYIISQSILHRRIFLKTE